MASFDQTPQQSATTFVATPVAASPSPETPVSLEPVAPAIENPTAPVIGDKIAKPLWITLALIAASAPYVFPLTVVNWSAWDATIAGQVSSLVVAWAGSVAAVLGLSRYTKTSQLGS